MNSISQSVIPATYHQHTNTQLLPSAPTVAKDDSVAEPTNIDEYIVPVDETTSSIEPLDLSLAKQPLELNIFNVVKKSALNKRIRLAIKGVLPLCHHRCRVN